MTLRFNARRQVSETSEGVGAPPAGDEVDVRHLDRLEEFATAVDLLCQVWAAHTAEDLVNMSSLRMWSMSGNYVVGAFVGDEMVGAAIAFRGDSHVHSHIVGVHREWQGQGIGYQIKQHQAEWALAQGFSVIRWTFDPLVRRNAHFSLRKLGGQVVQYDENFYGRLNDGTNDGDETDRLLIEWPLPRPSPATTESPSRAGADEAVCLIATPTGIEDMRRSDPETARWWRLSVRTAFQKALSDGFVVTEFTPDGSYLLRHES